MNPAAVQFEELPRIVFFDTNFFRALLKGDFNQQMADLTSDLRAAIKLPFTPWRTAFSFMEWIGLNSKSLPKTTEYDPVYIEETNFINQAYKHYDKHYANIRELEPSSLKKKAEDQRNHVCPEMLDLWDNAFRGFFDKYDVSEWLRFGMCFDAVHKLDISPDYRREYWSQLVVSAFFNTTPRVRNLSKFRLAYRIWLQTREKLKKFNTSVDQIRCIEESHQLLCCGNWEDYLDGDLIHVAAYGVEKPDGSRHRAICITCDNPNVVIMRIRLYKGLLSYVRKLYREQADPEGYPIDYETSHNGEVHCFDSQGNLVRLIDVVSETPALLFLGKEPS